MISYKRISHAVSRRIRKMLLTPIEVFVFHAVTDEFDETLNVRDDWSSTEEFKSRILDYQRQYKFISLSEAYAKIKNDRFRRGRYAVLTCDDGFLSVLTILPFLEQHRIPITLFVNVKYLDGQSRRDGYAVTPQYLTLQQLNRLTGKNITIGYHGYEHNNATEMTSQEFAYSVERCIDALKDHPRVIPFYAYTWGCYSDKTQAVLSEMGIVPVLTDGLPNYKYAGGISRKPIDSYYIEKRN